MTREEFTTLQNEWMARRIMLDFMTPDGVVVGQVAVEPWSDPPAADDPIIATDPHGASQ